MTTYIVGDSPVRIDDAASAAATITVTGDHAIIVRPTGERVGPGESLTIPTWGLTPTYVTVPHGNPTTVDVTLTAGAPAAEPGPAPLVVDPRGRSLDINVTGATLYTTPALTTPVTFPQTIATRTSYYPAAKVGLTVTAKEAGVVVDTLGCRLETAVPVEWQPAAGATAGGAVDYTAVYAPVSQDWTPGRSYLVGELASNGGALYRATAAHTAGGSFDVTKFAAVSSAGAVDASATVKGTMQFAGDLAGAGGTAAAPRVSGIQGVQVPAVPAPTAAQTLVATDGTNAVWRTLPGRVVGTAATFATLPATDSNGTGVVPGDVAILTADTVGTGTALAPQYPRGHYAWDGTAWGLAVAAGGTGSASPTTTKGDLIARDATTDVRVPVGGDGLVVAADSTAAAGVAWRAQHRDRAAWATGAAYAAGDVVTSSGARWLALSTHTAGATFAADTARWAPLTVPSAGRVIGSAATFGALPVVDAAGNTPTVGDWVILTADTIGTGTALAPQYPRGVYRWDGATYVSTLPTGTGSATITGQYVGSAATYATLPTTDAVGAAVSNGDWAALTTDVVGTGSVAAPQYPRGAYVHNGATYSLALAMAAPLATLTTKGDLLSHDGTTLARQPAGTAGQILTADPAAATGVAYRAQHRDRGAWVASTAYLPGDVVTYLEWYWVTVTPHTSGAVFDQLLWARTGTMTTYTYVGDWVPSTPWQTGQLVTAPNGRLYARITGGNGAATFGAEALWWTPFDGTAAPAWAASAPYQVGSLVWEGGALYRAVTAHTSGAVFAQGADWLPVTATPATGTTTGTVTLAGDLAGTGGTAAVPRVSGVQAVAVSDVDPTARQILRATNGTTASWSDLDAIRTWTTGTAYVVGDVVSTPVGVWRRTVAGTAGATFDAGEQANWVLLANLVTDALTFKGGWDASVGTFPGGGTAAVGDFYKVTTGGIVGGVTFAVGDSIFAEKANASTTVYATNWVAVATTTAGPYRLAFLSSNWVLAAPNRTLTVTAATHGQSTSPFVQVAQTAGALFDKVGVGTTVNAAGDVVLTVPDGDEFDGEVLISAGLGGGGGSSPSTTTASYLRGSRTAAQTTGLGLGGDVVFTTVEATAGTDIALNTTTGAITLKAGKTYRLAGSYGTAAGTSRFTFSWVNQTAGGLAFGSAPLAYSPADSAGNTSSGGPATAWISPVADTVVSLRLIAVASGSLTSFGGNGDAGTASGSYPWFEVEVVGGGTFVDPTLVPVTALHRASLQATIGDVNTVTTVATSVGSGYFVPNFTDAVAGNVIYDPNGIVNVASNRVTITQAGVYRVTMDVRAASSFEPAIMIDGVAVSVGDIVALDQIHREWIGPLTVGQRIDFRVLSSASANAANGFGFTVDQMPTSTVVDPGAVTVNDQSAGGYIDVGGMRLQWGQLTNTLDAAQTVTLHAAFASTAYTVSLTPDDGWTAGAGTVTPWKWSGKTTTAFNVDRDDDVTGTALVDWIAVGRRP